MLKLVIEYDVESEGTLHSTVLSAEVERSVHGLPHTFKVLTPVERDEARPGALRVSLQPPAKEQVTSDAI